MAERWNDGKMERGAEVADGSQNIRDKMTVPRLVYVFMCGCVGCHTGRKIRQPEQFAHLIRSLRERAAER